MNYTSVHSSQSVHSASFPVELKKSKKRTKMNKKKQKYIYFNCKYCKTIEAIPINLLYTSKENVVTKTLCPTCFAKGHKRQMKLISDDQTTERRSKNNGRI